MAGGSHIGTRAIAGVAKRSAWDSPCSVCTCRPAWHTDFTRRPRDRCAHRIYCRVNELATRSSGREMAQTVRIAKKAGKKMRQATATRAASAHFAATFGTGAQCGSST
eukprot:2386350-Prymnesium_polylepis.1